MELAFLINTESGLKIKTGFLIAVVQIFCLAATFLRNFLIARFLTPFDVAVSVLLSVVISTLELVTNVGLQNFIIRSTDDERDEVLGCAHLIAITRGVALSAIGLATASWWADFFDMSDALMGFALISAVPILNGFINLDVFHQHRQYRYLPTCMSELFSNAISLLVVGVCVGVLGDYRAFALAMIAQSLVNVVLSNLYARVSFRVCVSRDTLRSISKYGFPLLLNGMLLASTINGDRLVLASAQHIASSAAIKVEDFASYSLCFGLILAVTTAVTKFSNTILQPLLATTHNNPSELNRIGRVFLQGHFFCSSILILVFALVGPVLIELVYGAKYQLHGVTAVLIAIGLGCRTMRTVPTAISLNFGNTWSVLGANVFRSLAIPLMVVLIRFDVGVNSACISIVVCEEIAMLYALYAANRRDIAMQSGVYVVFISHILVSILASIPLILPDSNHALSAVFSVCALGIVCCTTKDFFLFTFRSLFARFVRAI